MSLRIHIHPRLSPWSGAPSLSSSSVYQDQAAITDRGSSRGVWLPHWTHRRYGPDSHGVHLLLSLSRWKMTRSILHRQPKCCNCPILRTTYIDPCSRLYSICHEQSTIADHCGSYITPYARVGSFCSFCCAGTAAGWHPGCQCAGFRRLLAGV